MVTNLREGKLWIKTNCLKTDLMAEGLGTGKYQQMSMILCPVKNILKNVME